MTPRAGFLVALACLLVFGCAFVAYRSGRFPLESPALQSAIGESHDLLHLRAPAPDTAFDARRAEVGDKVAGLKIVRISDITERSEADYSASVAFSGEVILSGTYLCDTEESVAVMGGSPGVHFFVDGECASSLPKIQGDDRTLHFAFSNYHEALEFFGPPGRKGAAVVVIDDYTINFVPSCAGVNRARLVKVVPTVPGSEELVKAFREAELAYSWFNGYSQIEVDPDSIQYVGEDQYYEVKHEGITSRAQLYGHLCSCFSETLARQLVETRVRDGHLFSDIEGRLHVFGGHVGIYTYDMVETELAIKYVSDVIITLSASISWDAGGKTYYCGHDYRYERGVDGRWRFADFQLPAKICVDSVAPSG